MRLVSLRSAQVMVATLGALASTTALAWGDAAVSAWTARNAALAAAVDQPIGEGAPPDASGKQVLHVVNTGGFLYKKNAEEKASTEASGAYVVNIVEQCKGLTGELIKNGGRNMPTWAQTAQQKFCSGAKALENAVAGDAGDKQRCKDLASAISYAEKAKAGEDPEAIVQSAAQLAAAAEKLRGIPILMTRKAKLLGDSQRTFTCD